MWVEVVKSIARYPARSIAGAIVSVLAVVTPSAPHRHWLPSRRLVSTIWMSAIVSPRAPSVRCADTSPVNGGGLKALQILPRLRGRCDPRESGEKAEGASHLNPSTSPAPAAGL